MKIGIIQASVGATGGNDTVLRDVIDILKPEHDIILYSFDRPSKRFSDVKTVSKIPLRLPILGIYKKFFMPKFDFGDREFLFSITGHARVKTDKPLLVYDQNNLGLELLDRIVSKKYQKGLWKYYYKPYQLINKFHKPNPNAQYIANSDYAAGILQQAVKKDVGVLYPAVDLSQYSTIQKKDQIAMLCRISPEKNLEFAIDVLNRQTKPVIIIGAITNMTMRYFTKLQDMCKPHVRISPNISRDNLKFILSESKVFFHTANETFGISVVEAIASGCIPIVPNNSAHPETVPIDELRYHEDDLEDAITHLKNAFDGKYDRHVSSLQKNIKKFDRSVFEREIRNWIRLPG